jgi:hypothetical protein
MGFSRVTIVMFLVEIRHDAVCHWGLVDWVDWLIERQLPNYLITPFSMEKRHPLSITFITTGWVLKGLKLWGYCPSM